MSFNWFIMVVMFMMQQKMEQNKKYSILLWNKFNMEICLILLQKLIGLQISWLELILNNLSRGSNKFIQVGWHTVI